MPIHVPGKRARNGKVQVAKRNVVAVLSLTAMVDMFTVLAVFLLQNYNVTGQVIELDQGIELPTAGSVKELKPSRVVQVSTTQILLDKASVTNVADVESQTEWEIPNLISAIEAMIRQEQAQEATFGAQLKQDLARGRGDSEEDPIKDYLRMTIQAHKEISFLTLKKVMYSLTKAGIQEINFAVLKEQDETTN